jgi:fibronectin-binding autotransporter adhesin
MVRAACLAAIGGTPLTLRAQISGSWVNSGSGAWGNGANWSCAPLFPDGGGTATFDRNNVEATLGADVSLSAIRFDTPGTISLATLGPSVTLTGVAQLDAAQRKYWYEPASISAPAPNRTTIRTPLFGSSGLTKTGPGWISLQVFKGSGYTGQTRITAGTLEIGSSLDLGADSSPVVLDGGTLRGLPGNRSLVIAAGGGTLVPSISSIIENQLLGDGPLSVLAGLNSVRLTSSSPYSGALTIFGLGSDEFSIASTGQLGTNSVNVVHSSFLLDNTATVNTDRIPDTANVRLTNSWLRMSGAAAVERIGTLTIGAGTSQYKNQSTGGRIWASALAREERGLLEVNAGTLVFDNASAFLVGAGGSGSLSSVVPLARYTGSGSAPLMTYTSSGGLVPITNYATSMPAGVTAQNVAISSTSTQNAPVTVNALAMLGGSLQGSSTVTITSGAVVGQGSVFAPLAFGAGEAIFNADPTQELRVYSGISGTNGLTIGGRVMLAGNSAYTGTTTIGGTLRIEQNVPASGAGPLGADHSPVVLAGSASIITTAFSVATLTFGRDLLVKNCGDNDPNHSPSIGGIIVNGNIQLERQLDISLGNTILNGNIDGPGRINCSVAISPSVVISGNNTFSGGINVRTGTFTAGSDAAFGTGSVLVGGGTYLTGSTGFISAINASSRTLANGFALCGPMRFTGTVPITVTGPLFLNGEDFQVFVDTTINDGVTLAGSISGGTFAYGGPGILKVTGAGTQWANIVNGGRLRIDNSLGLGARPLETLINASSTLELAQSVVIPPHPLRFRNGALRSIEGNNVWSGDFQIDGFSANVIVDADTLKVDGAVTFLAGHTLNKMGEGRLALDNIRGPELDVHAGVVQVLPNGTAAGASNLGSLVIDGGDTPTARFDLTDNSLVINYSGSSPLPTIRSQIRSAYADGSWIGNGITTSMAASDSSKRIGYAEASAMGLSSFAGQDVDRTSVIVDFTYAGDANLDGVVDVTDLGTLATNWQTSNAAWTSGDFNYDGLVDVTDLGALATNWQAGVGNPLAPSLDAALAAVGLPVSSIPEPGDLVGCGLAALALRTRLRRR